MTTNLARAIKVIDRTAEKVGTRAPLLAVSHPPARQAPRAPPRTDRLRRHTTGGLVSTIYVSGPIAGARAAREAS